jgi:hypothetical protein
MVRKLAPLTNLPTPGLGKSTGDDLQRKSMAGATLVMGGRVRVGKPSRTKKISFLGVIG